MGKVLGLYKNLKGSGFYTSTLEYFIHFLVATLITGGFFVASSFIQNISAILYTLYCLFLIFYFYKKQVNIKIILFLVPISINIIFILSNLLTVNNLDYFANFDTLNNFYPKAEEVASKIFGSSDLILPKNWNEKFLIFDFINAFLINFFGRNEVVFMMLLSLYKGVAALFIYKTTNQLFSENHGKLASLLYIFNPLYIIHSAFIFKEAWVQMLFAIFIYILISFYKKPSSKTFLILSGVVGLFCIWERIYLLIPVSLALVSIVILSFKKINKLITLLLVLTIVMLGFYLTKLLSSFDKAISYLESTRAFYSTYSDVDSKINYDIGYFLGFVKLMFSPYPNLRKLDLFNGISLLIFWASFFSQAITLGMFIGLYRSNIGKLKLVLALGFIGFLAFLSYITPYGFRQRDSMAILYVMFAGYFLLPILEKIYAKLKSNLLDKYPKTH